MYEEHHVFKQPADENAKVWRYMDFTKLISLLESTSLFFTRADKFDDTFEGSTPKINYENFQALLMPTEAPPEVRIRNHNSFKDMRMLFRKQYMINCWHLNQQESAAMWKLYLKSNEGVAIQSTYSKLKKCLIDDENVYLGMVNYIDYENETIGNGLSANGFEYFMHKRKFFEHENEVRAIATRPDNCAGDYISTSDGVDTFVKNTQNIEHGIEINIDIKTLIEKIYVAPSSSPSFVERIKSVVNKYDYKFEVVPSQLDNDPLH